MTSFKLKIDLGVTFGVIFAGVGIWKATGSGWFALAAIGAVMALAPHMED